MAASFPILEECDDLFTCSVCFEHFNNEANKPKFLSCHHTLCLNCVKAMATRLTVTCPVCRKHTKLDENNTFELPNNYYILQMMANKKSSPTCYPKPKSNVFSLPSPKEMWCLRCRKEPSDLCPLLSGHPVISLGSSSIKFCLDLQESIDTNKSQLKKVIERRIEAKSNYSLVFAALKVVEDAVKKLEEENDLRFVEMVSLLESFEMNSVIGEGDNAQSLAKKVQECTQSIHKELADFQRLEEPFLTIIKDVKSTAQLVNPEGRLNEHNITLPIAFHILFALLRPVTGKLHTSIPAGLPKTPPKPLPKPTFTGIQRWMPDSATLLSKFRLQNQGSTSSSNENSLQTQQTAVASSIKNQASNNNSNLRRFLSVPSLLPARVSQNEVGNPFESLRSPTPVPSRNTPSSNSTQLPTSGGVQPTGNNSATIRNPLPNPNSMSRPYSRYSWVFPVDIKIESDL